MNWFQIDDVHITGTLATIVGANFEWFGHEISRNPIIAHDAMLSGSVTFALTDSTEICRNIWSELVLKRSNSTEAPKLLGNETITNETEGIIVANDAEIEDITFKDATAVLYSNDTNTVIQNQEAYTVDGEEYITIAKS